MSTAKPGDLMSYEASGEARTGIVLDAAPIYREPDACERRRGLDKVLVSGVAYWVHREDGSFDKVRIVASGKRKGETTWLGQFTPAGVPIVAQPIRSAESA